VAEDRKSNAYTDEQSTATKPKQRQTQTQKKHGWLALWQERRGHEDSTTTAWGTAPATLHTKTTGYTPTVSPHSQKPQSPKASHTPSNDLGGGCGATGGGGGAAGWRLNQFMAKVGVSQRGVRATAPSTCAPHQSWQGAGAETTQTQLHRLGQEWADLAGIGEGSPSTEDAEVEVDTRAGLTVATGSTNKRPAQRGRPRGVLHNAAAGVQATGHVRSSVPDAAKIVTLSRPADWLLIEKRIAGAVLAAVTSVIPERYVAPCGRPGGGLLRSDDCASRTPLYSAESSPECVAVSSPLDGDVLHRRAPGPCHLGTHASTAGGQGARRRQDSAIARGDGGAARAGRESLAAS